MSIRVDASTDLAQRTANLPAQTSYTACGWLRVVTDRSGQWRYFFLLEANNGNSWNGIGWRSSNSLEVTNSSGGNGNVATFSANPPVDGTWFFWAVSCGGLDAANLKGYWRAHGDRSFTKDTGASGSNAGSFTPTTLTLLSDTVSEWVNGEMAGVKIWDAVLTEAELWQESLQLLPVRKANLNGFYPLFTTAGNDHLVDYSGLGHAIGTQSGLTTGTQSPPVPMIRARQRRRVPLSGTARFVQGNKSVQTTTVALPGVTAGNLIVLHAKWEWDGAQGSKSDASASDGTSSLTVGNRADSADIAGVSSQFLYLLSANGGDKTYTVTFPANANTNTLSITAAEYAGKGTWSLDVQNTGNGNGTSGSTGNVTTTGTDEIVIGGTGLWGSSQEPIGSFQINSVSAGGPLLAEVPGWPDSAMWWRSVTSTFTGNASCSYASADEWSANVIAFKLSTSTDITATLSATLGALTSSADASISLTADLAKTLGTLTTTADASVSLTADLAQTLGALTLSADASVAGIAADLAVTLAALTSSADASLNIVASATPTLGSVTLSADAALGIAAASSTTLDAATASATASLEIAADLAKTLDALSLAATATVITGSVLDLDQTLDALTLSSTALLERLAALDQALGSLSVASTASVALKADLAKTLDAVTLTTDVNTGAPRTANLSVTLDAVTLSTSVTVSQPEVQSTGGSGQYPKRRGRRKPSFIGVSDVQPKRINATASLTLDDMVLVSTAVLGESPSKRKRRHTLTVLLS